MLRMLISASAVMCLFHQNPTAAATPPASKAAKYIILQRVVLTDQNDGQPAFTMLIPTAWKAGSTITYRMDRPAAPADIAIRATSPDGNEEFSLAPQISATWSPMLARSGLRRNLGYEVMQCPDTASKFISQLALPRLRPFLNSSNCRVIETQDYPKVARALNASARQRGIANIQAQVSRVRVEYKEPRTNQLVNEDITGTLWIGVSQGTTTWLMEKTYACRAPAGSLGRHADLFSCMAASVRPDAQWIDRYVKAMNILIKGEYDRQAAVMKQSQIIAQNGREISQIIHDTYANHTRTQDRVMDQWAQAIRGTQTYVSPHENYPVELPGGYSQVWTSGKGQYILSNDVTYNPNQGTNVTWVPMNTAG